MLACADACVADLSSVRLYGGETGSRAAVAIRSLMGDAAATPCSEELGHELVLRGSAR